MGWSKSLSKMKKGIIRLIDLLYQHFSATLARITGWKRENNIEIKQKFIKLILKITFLTDSAIWWVNFDS